MRAPLKAALKETLAFCNPPPYTPLARRLIA
jgi:hypothetical protein